MKKRVFARSPGLIFASANLFSHGLGIEKLNQTKLEAEQRLVKLSTGSPSLTYDIDIAEGHELPGSEISQVAFGIETTDGLLIRDGYNYASQDRQERSFLLNLVDGYYRISIRALPTLLDGEMRLQISTHPVSQRIPEQLVDLDYMPATN